MGLIETIGNIGYIFISGVLVLAPIALIDGYFTQQDIRFQLEGIKHNIHILKEEHLDAQIGEN